MIVSSEAVLLAEQLNNTIKGRRITGQTIPGLLYLFL